MYTIYSTVADTYQTGVRPTAQQIFNQFLNKLGYKDRFKGCVAYETYVDTNTTASNEHNAPTMAEDSATVRVNYSMNEDNLIWSNAAAALMTPTLSGIQGMRADQKALFEDTELRMWLHHYERPMAIVMECALDFIDFKEANDCMQRLKAYTQAQLFEYDLDYSYYIPIEIYGVIYTLYKMANKDPALFFTYLAEHSNQALLRIQNRHNVADKALIARVPKSRLVCGLVCSQDVPEPTGDSKSPMSFRVTVTLSTQFNAPHLMALAFPLVVNNQQIPRAFIPVKPQQVDKTLDAAYPFRSIDAFKDALFSRATYELKHTPWYDNWTPLTFFPRFKPILAGLVLLDNTEVEGGNTIVNLETAYSSVIGEDVLALYKANYDRVLGFDNLISVVVYQDQVLIDPSVTPLDENLNLTIPNLNVMSTYHIVFSYNPTDYTRTQALRIINADIVSKRNPNRPIVGPELTVYNQPVIDPEATQQTWRYLLTQVATDFDILVDIESIPQIPTVPSDIPNTDDGGSTEAIPEAEHFVTISAEMSSNYTLTSSASALEGSFEDPPDVIIPQYVSKGQYGEYSFSAVMSSIFTVLTEIEKQIPIPTVPASVPEIQSGTDPNLDLKTTFIITGITTQNTVIPTVPLNVSELKTNADGITELLTDSFTIQVSKSINPIIPTVPSTINEVKTDSENPYLKFNTTFTTDVVHRAFKVREQLEDMGTAFTQEVECGTFPKTEIEDDGLQPQFTLRKDLLTDCQVEISIDDTVQLSFTMDVVLSSIDYPFLHVVGDTMEGDIYTDDSDGDGIPDDWESFKDGSLYNAQGARTDGSTNRPLITTFTLNGAVTPITPKQLSEIMVPSLSMVYRRDRMQNLDDGTAHTFQVDGEIAPYPTAVVEDDICPTFYTILRPDVLKELQETLANDFQIESSTFPWAVLDGVDNTTSQLILIKRMDTLYELDETIGSSFDLDVIWLYLAEKQEEVTFTFMIDVIKERTGYTESPPTESHGITFTILGDIQLIITESENLTDGVIEQNMLDMGMIPDVMAEGKPPLIAKWEIGAGEVIQIPCRHDYVTYMLGDVINGTIVVKNVAQEVLQVKSFVGAMDASQFSISGLTAGQYTTEIYGTLPYFSFFYTPTSNALIREIVQLGDVGLIDAYGMVHSCPNVTQVASGECVIRTSVFDMYRMCYNTPNLTRLDLSTMTNQATNATYNVQGLCEECPELTYLHLKDMAIATTIDSMCKGCALLPDVGFIIDNVELSTITDADSAFYDCVSMTQTYINSTLTIPAGASQNNIFYNVPA